MVPFQKYEAIFFFMTLATQCHFNNRISLNMITAIGQYIGQTQSVLQLLILNCNVPKIANAPAA